MRATTMDISMDYKELIKDLIRDEIGERRSDINQVKEVIRNKIVERRNDFQQVTDQTGEKQHAKLSLSTIDSAYIQQTYIGYCMKFWIQEVESYLKNNQRKLSSGNLNHEIVQDFLNSLHTIKNLKQIPEPLNQLQYYNLLMEHHNLIGSNNENTFLKKFRSICYEQIIAYIESAQPELDFLKAFIDFLLASRNIHEIIEELQLQSFCRGNLPFDKLIDGIRNLKTNVCETEVLVLKDTVDCLEYETELLLTKIFKETIAAYIKPVEMQQKTLDGRLVIELTGKCVVMSKILPKLETLISDILDIEEVRIVGADILHVDMDLKNEIWHGKNVFILAKMIKIHDKATWDVSGKDNSFIYSSDAGTGENGHGQNGADGFPGESGGNVLILANEIKNPDLFTVISHGGKGGKGQNGGNGRDGDDGKGITKEEFEEKFPSVVLFFNDRLKRGCLFDVTVENIMISSTTANRPQLENGNEFITTKTNEGNEITFSYCNSLMDTCLQTFLLYKGSFGKPGGRGGEYGLGGEGGHKGIITIYNTDVNVYADRGKVGENGKGGMYGQHGKNAWDMGYADYQGWPKAAFYGMDQCSKLKLTYHDTTWGSAPKDSVWCPYHQKYAQITRAGKVEQKEKKYKEQTDTRQNNTRQHQAMATKKKIILQGKMMADYSHSYTAIEQNALKSSQVTLDNLMQRALQEIVENSEQQEKVRAEMKVRHVRSAPQDRDMHCRKITAATSSVTSKNTTNVDIESLMNLLTSDGGLDGQQKELKNIELNYSELDTIFFEIERKKHSSFRNSEERNLEQILMEKYRFAVLREIADELPGNRDIRSPMVIPECVSRYLTVAEQNTNDISHPVLGTLNQYLYKNNKEQREQVYTFFHDNIQNGEDYESLKSSVGIFVLKVGRSEQSHPNVRKFYLEYEEFLKTQDQSLNVFLEPLCTELRRHKHLFALWIERNNNHLARIKLSEEIRKNEFLSAMYRRYNNQLEKAYPWDECCRDKGFLEEYRDHLCEKGPFSECYRELLAHVFDVNIKLYYKEQDNQFYMLDNHKPSSERAIHVLKRGNELKQLNIDHEYLRLEEERTEIGLMYANILTKTKAFTKKQEFDDYLQNHSSSPEDVSENDSHSSYASCSDEYENISEYDTEELEDIDDKVLTQSVRAYILEVGASENVLPEVKKYYTEFKEFSEKREQLYDVYFEPFHNELKRYEHVYSLWLASDTNESARSELEEEMKKYDLLNALHNRFDSQLKNFEYDWTECCENAAVLKAHERYIRENDLPSESYREPRHHHFADQDGLLRNSYTHYFAGDESALEEFDYASKTQLTCSPVSDVPDNEYLVREEQDINEIVKYFDSPDERLQMKERLEKITYQYTGQCGILHYLLSRFSNDGRHLSFQELCYLVNSILTSVVRGRRELIIFCWIVAAYPQNGWLDELVLLQLENYFKKPLVNKSEWRKYLSEVKNKDILLSLASKLDQHKSNGRYPVMCIEEALNFLGKIPNEVVNLEGLDLREWADALKEKYWTHELSKLSNWQGSDDLSEASYYLLALEDTCGPLLVQEFVEILKGKQVLPRVLIEILSNFYTERWTLSKEVLKELYSYRITKWMKKMKERCINDQKERDVTQLVELIRSNANTSDNIAGQLSTIENSLHSIRKEKPASDGQTKGTLKRIFNWFNSTTNTSEGTSERSLAIDNSANPVSKLKQFVRWIKNDDISSEETSNRLPEFEDPISHNREKICSTTEDIADNMTKDDLTIYARMFRDCLDSYQDIGEKRKFIEEARIGMLAVIDKAIQFKRGFKLRDTQKVAILALLANERNTLAQVSTGEGKSLIVVAASIVKAICREKVDIITSSSVLAKRDAECNRDIYSLFDISVSHNCSEDIEQRRQAYSSGQVVYGDLANFQRDYLLDRFYEKNLLGDRNFENVFVDEVDSMLLDKGNNMLYLSHDLPGLDKLESLQVYIWQWVNRPAKNREDFSSIFDTATIRESVLNDLYGLIKKEDMKKLDSKLDDQQATVIWDRLIEAEVLDDQGKMLVENIDENQLEKVLSSKFNVYKHRLRYLLKESVDRIKMIHVPNYLKPFIEQHLETWIKSAITATLMQEGHDYVMDVDKTGTSQDMNPHVTIVDRDTGTYQANSQWDEALHQYLQLKHGCKLSLQSLKAVFISNVSYLKLYKNLYGVTGTLGSRRERDLLLEIHEVDFVTIPTAMPKQFTEEKPILCTAKEMWIDKIFSEAMGLTEKLKRSVLIICETINDAENLYRNFVERGASNIHTYTRDYNELDIAQGTKELEPGHVIIATNLCGRGTDIKITEELRKSGGLHVVLTYLPKNSRIEEQAFGRGARCGDKGSGRLIIMDSKGKDYNNLRILDFKKQRDAEESLRIPDMKAYYETQIIPEEYCFDEFDKQYKILRENLTKKNVHVEAQKILMQSCLNKWAFWLDNNSKRLKNLVDGEDETELKNSLKEFISQLNNLKDVDTQNTWVEGQPVQMVKLGKHFCQVGKYNDAIELFDKVIELEPCFSEAAHYYKAHALMKNIDWTKKSLFKQSLKECKMELRKAGRLFEEHSRFSKCVAGTIETIKEHNQNSIIQIDTYKKQQESFSNLYDIFSQSIDDVFDQPITPRSFVIKDDINADLSETIYENLLSNDILKTPSVENDISEEARSKISFEYGISLGELQTCLSALQGKKIGEREFKQTFKIGLQLPSREDFWQLLIQEDIISQEIRCIIIDVEKLDEVDPLFSRSLHNKIQRQELHQQTLKCHDPNEIILTEQAHSPKEYIILEKSVFQKVLANDNRKYEFLKRRGVFTSNKKARVDLTKIASSLPRYDSITLNDFGKEKIAGSDAEKILAGLVEENVLKKENSENDIYRLVIPSSEIKQIQFSAYPIYRNAVIGLLSLCFIYRISLERIKEQLENKNIPTDERLSSKPHHHLIYDLMDQNIISPVKYETKTKNLKQKLQIIYSRSLTKNDLKSMLSESRLIPEEYNTEDLYNHLVEKKWLSLDEGEPDVPKTDRTYACLVEMNSIFAPQYYINDSEGRQDLSSFEDVEETIKKIFDDRLKLAKEATIHHIVSVLEKSRSPLNTLQNGDSNLQPLTESRDLDGSRHTEEVNVLTLNGLDHILRIEESKWSLKMLFNTGIVILIGILQIIAGILIDIVTSAFTIAASFISEGISDVLFGIQVLCSGRFSWMDYVRHKIRSLMLTFANFSFRALFSAGANVMRFGSKVAESTLNIGENVATTTSSQLLETVGARGLVVAAENQIISRTIDAATDDLAYGGVNIIVESYLKMLCDDICSAFISAIKKKMGEFNVPLSLEKIYRSLGRVGAMKLVADLANSFFNDTGLTEKYLPIASRTGRSATRGIEHAVENIRRSENTRYTSLAEVVRAVLTLVPTAEDLVNVDNVQNATGSLMNNLQRKLMIEARDDNLEENPGQNVADRSTDEQACEKFKKKSIKQWHSLIDEKIGRIMERHVVRPILREGAGCLKEYCEKIITDRYQLGRVGRNNEDSRELARQYQESQRYSFASESNDLSEVETYTLNEYYNNLNMLTTKITNHKLLAALVRENVPMDVTCLNVCVKIISKISGIGGLTISAKGTDGTKQRFSFPVDGAAEMNVIQLELINNRFLLHGSGASESNRNCDRKNNYLYEAISGSFNLNMTREEFRAEVANGIEDDPDAQRHINQGSNLVSTSSASGGRRENQSGDKLCTNPIDEEVRFSRRSTTNSKTYFPTQNRQLVKKRSRSMERPFSTKRHRVRRFSTCK